MMLVGGLAGLICNGSQKLLAVRACLVEARLTVSGLDKAVVLVRGW